MKEISEATGEQPSYFPGKQSLLRDVFLLFLKFVPFTFPLIGYKVHLYSVDSTVFIHLFDKHLSASSVQCHEFSEMNHLTSAQCSNSAEKTPQNAVITLSRRVNRESLHKEERTMSVVMGEFLVKGTFQLDLASKQELIRGIRTDGLRINYQSIVESERQII